MYNIEYGNHEGGKWAVHESIEYDTYELALEQLLKASELLKLNKDVPVNIKMVNTTNPKQPKHAHFITNHYPNVWVPDAFL